VQVEALAVLGHHCVPAELADDPPAQRERCPLLAVHHEHAGGSPLGGAEPVDQLAAVGVHREAAEVADLGAHGHVPTVDLHRVGAVHQTAAARARGLEADQCDRVRRVGQEPLEVVHHTAARRHAAAGDHDRRAAASG
jgi:hypothetical protein